MAAVSSQSRAQTAALVGVIATLVEWGDMLELSGPIGAGKTAFVADLAAALGSRDAVRSPTFTVAHVHQLADGRSLAHLDLYRQAGVLDESALGDLEPSLEADLLCVEWPGALGPWRLDRPRWQLTFEPIAAAAAAELDALHEAPRVVWAQAPDAQRSRALALALAAAPARGVA